MNKIIIPSTAYTDILVCDEPGAGNANHVYEICRIDEIYYTLGSVKFQKGPIENKIANGVMNEDLLTIVIHRLQGFQEGPFRCQENALALIKIQEALRWLNRRTANRVARNVEGTYQL